jgi:hypothetical protein
VTSVTIGPGTLRLFAGRFACDVSNVRGAPSDTTRPTTTVDEALVKAGWES